MHTLLGFCTPLKGKRLKCMIKLIASDMDGTFLDDKHSYDKKRFSELLDKLDKLGIVFVVASGRSLLTLEELFADFIDRVAFVAENGSVVTYKGQLISESVMSKDQYLTIARQLDKMPDCQGYLLSGRHGAFAPLFAKDSYIKHVGQYYVNIVKQDLAQVTDEIFKVTAQLEAETIEDGSQALSQLLDGVTAVTTGFDGMDIILESVNKATGLRSLGRHLGIKAEQVMAFGDNGNDIEMLELAGKAIATENAKVQVKAIANQVIGHCNDRAVQRFLEEWVIENDY